MGKKIITPRKLTLSFLEDIWKDFSPISLDKSAYKAIDTSNDYVNQIIARGKPAYGINTGFGLLAKEHISNEQLELLQKNLILSHSVGVGKPLNDSITRLLMVMKISSLSQGASGVRRCLVDKIIEVYNAKIIPQIPEKGSVGASGDLAPLSHLSLALIGEGNVKYKGEIRKTIDVFKELKIEPITLSAKEGLALINGTQVSTALSLNGLFLARQLLEAGVTIGALSVDAAKGSDTPFDPRIHEARGQHGQIKLATTYRELLLGSEIRASHKEIDDRVQDPYCLRCQPQVMGACLDLINQSAKTLLIEANAITDNPLIFKDDTPKALSGGNFHAEPVAFASDVLALAISEIGAISERRVALLIDSTLSGLPPFLVKNPGVNSGFMIAHVTAAALASENKSLAHPASVDSIPTSANQEDHVSMATFAGRRLADMAKNTANILAIEWLAASQGIDFHEGLKTSKSLLEIHEKLRACVPNYDKDRLFAPDILSVCELIEKGEVTKTVKLHTSDWYDV